MISAGIDLGNAVLAKHGSTLVINMLQQRSGTKTAQVTTRGFRDTLEAARDNQTNPFRVDCQREPPLVPRPLRFEVNGQIRRRGEVLAAPNAGEVERRFASE